MTRRRSVSADARLRDCPERSVGLALPGPLSDRVDALVAISEEAGERTNRKELIASLILDAPANGNALRVVLERYRRSSAGEALVDDRDRTTIALTRPRPGPRPRSRG
jgi:hypothetical protein